MGNKESTAVLSDDTLNYIELVFREIDSNENGRIELDELTAWWNNNFALVNARAMLESIDNDKNECIDFFEWVYFWKVVKNCGYSETDIVEELTRLRERKEWTFISQSST